MERVATRRLIDASASLGAADRALLNLWINRGLDDGALGRLTGVNAAAIADRRGRIVTQLSEELGLPPEDVKQALEQIAASTERPMPGVDAAGSNGSVQPATPGTDQSAESSGPTAALNGHAPDVAVQPGEAADDDVTAGETAVAPEGTRAEETAAPEGESRPRRGRLLALLGVLAVAIVALVLVVTDGSGAKKPRRTRPPRVPAAQSTTAPAAPPPPTSPSPSPTVSRPPVQPLAALPGGVDRARGSIFLMMGKRHRLRLRLTVMGLPAAPDGHYEVWLYNSILDSVALARLRGGVHTLMVRLPRHARHFHWIDISFQPRGFVNHSGESVLRASNPARAGRRQLRHRSARRRELRRTTSGSVRPTKSR